MLVLEFLFQLLCGKEGVLSTSLVGSDGRSSPGQRSFQVSDRPGPAGCQFVVWDAQCQQSPVRSFINSSSAPMALSQFRLWR